MRGGSDGKKSAHGLTADDVSCEGMNQWSPHTSLVEEQGDSTYSLYNSVFENDTNICHSVKNKSVK